MFDLKIVQNRIIYRDRGQFSPNEFRLIFHVQLVHVRETIVSIIIETLDRIQIQRFNLSSNERIINTFTSYISIQTKSNDTKKFIILEKNTSFFRSSIAAYSLTKTPRSKTRNKLKFDSHDARVRKYKGKSRGR